MPMVKDPRWSAINFDGTPCSGARLYVYQNGTSIGVQTYSDPAMTVPNTNPLIADGRGYFPVFFVPAGTYKVVIETADGVLVTETNYVTVES